MVSLLDGQVNYVPKEELNLVTIQFLLDKNRRWGLEELKSRMTRPLPTAVEVPPLPEHECRKEKCFGKDESPLQTIVQEIPKIPSNSENQKKYQNFHFENSTDNDHDSVGPELEMAFNSMTNAEWILLSLWEDVVSLSMLWDDLLELVAKSDLS